MDVDGWGGAFLLLGFKGLGIFRVQGANAKQWHLLGPSSEEAFRDLGPHNLGFRHAHRTHSVQARLQLSRS